MKIKKLFLPLFMACCATASSFAQSAAEAPVAPELEYVLELKVEVGQMINVGPTSHGARMIIPITGGTFEGPGIKGVVLSGGADYQYVDSAKGRNEVEAIYTIRTDDGVNIHVRNTGIIYTKNTGGAPGFYFRTTPKFDAPNDSKYDYLNNAVFVCVPTMPQGYISLKVWKVK